MLKKKFLINKRFWNNHYNKFNLEKPSNFAKFCLKFIKKNDLNLDIGCGNGRDTKYFINKGLNFKGLDISDKAIKKNKERIGNFFYNINICDLSFKKYSIVKKKIDNIYARFFLHTITSQDENNFFKNSNKILKKKGKVFLEFRTIKDPMAKIGKKISYNERISDHYRRFILVEELKKLTKLNNFKIIYQKKSFNFARFKNQKPHICRMILVKN